MTKTDEKKTTEAKKPTFEELMNQYIVEETKAIGNMNSAVDTMADVMNKMPPDKMLEFANALTKTKSSSGKKTLIDRLMTKLRGKRAIIILATLGVFALASSLKSHDKGTTRSAGRDDAVPRDKTMAVLAVLSQDPHAFDVELKDSMESDCLLMNKKVLDALDGAFQKAGYIDKEGNLKKLPMVDISKADALGPLEAGLRAPSGRGH